MTGVETVVALKEIGERTREPLVAKWVALV